MNTVRRRTTAYRLEVVSDDPRARLDRLVARCKELGIDVEQTACYTGMCGIHFRVPTHDGEACRVAAEIAEGEPFHLSTGYGHHRKNIL